MRWAYLFVLVGGCCGDHWSGLVDAAPRADSHPYVPPPDAAPDDATPPSPPALPDMDPGFGAVVMPAGFFATDIIRLADGGFVLAGAFVAADAFDFATAALVRVDATGQLDPGFGDGGVARVELVPGEEELFLAVTVLPSGDLVAGGWAGHDFGAPVLARFTPKGQLDGVRIESAGDLWRHVVARPDDHVLACGAQNDQLLLAELDATGNLVAGPHVIAGAGYCAGVVEVAGDHALLLVQQFGSPAGVLARPALVRVNLSTGALVDTIDLLGPGPRYAYAARLDPDGRVLVAGAGSLVADDSVPHASVSHVDLDTRLTSTTLVAPDLDSSYLFFAARQSTGGVVGAGYRLSWTSPLGGDLLLLRPDGSLLLDETLGTAATAVLLPDDSLVLYVRDHSGQGYLIRLLL